MPTRKCLICKSTSQVFLWPKDSNMSNKWNKFVYNWQPEAKIGKSSGICYKHFKQTDFYNYDDWMDNQQKGRVTKLRKYNWAVPSTTQEVDKSVPTGSPARLPAFRACAQSTPSTSKCKVTSFNPPTTPIKRFLSSDEEEEHVLKRHIPVYEADKDYEPNKSSTLYAEEDQFEDELFDETFISGEKNNVDGDGKAWKEPKFIVPWKFLLWALSCCRVCGEKEAVAVSRSVIGAALTVHCECSKCGASYSKCTSDSTRRTHHINFLLSCAILFGGGIPTKILRIFSFAGICVPAVRTFFRHQKYYLHKAVRDVWLETQKVLISDIRDSGKALSLAGDGRCDSMGHSAKYGSYSLLDIDSKKILTTHLVQTKGNSNAMEMIGLKLCIQQIFQWKLNFVNFISDRHIQIRAFMRDTYGSRRKNRDNPEISHFLDIWHVAKGLKKDLKIASSKDPSGLLGEWQKAIVNHMYWVALSTQPTTYTTDWADVIEAKWRTLSNHIINRHKHNEPAYPRCAHPSRKKGDKKKKYMKPNTPEHILLCDVIEDRRRLKDVRQLSPLGQTSNLESFHAVINHFAPKMLHYPYKTMETRQLLAALHFNQNCGDGDVDERKLTVTYPKYKKGEASVKVVSRPANYDYVDRLFEVALEFSYDDCQDRNVPMSQLYNKTASKEELLRAYRRRFTK